jgi:hypothetical protein
MTDLITLARKEWCESRFGPNFPSDWTTPDHSHHQCPPEVVAALLDLREFMRVTITSCLCAACENRRQQRRELLAAVDTAITRALEGK